MKQLGYLIFDIGTGNMRVSVATTSGEIVAMERESMTYTRDYAYPDACFFSPEEVWNKLEKLAKKVVAFSRDIEIIGVTATSQRQGIVLINQDGTPFLGLPNIDNRGRQWERTYGEPDQIYNIAGRKPNALFSILKLLGLREKKFDTWREVTTFTSISEWVIYKLSGQIVYEASQAAETLLFDIRSNQWSDQLCRLYGISKVILPPLTHAGTTIGHTLPHINEMFNLDSVPVIVGGGDTQLAIESTGAQLGDTVIVSGTTTPIIKLLPDTFFDKQGRSWTNTHIHPDQWLIETNPGITGFNFQQIKSIFYQNETYEALEQDIQLTNHNECLASLGNYFNKDKNARGKGGFIFEVPLASKLTRADFVLAALKEIAFSIKLNVDILNDIFVTNQSYVWICGGGFQSPSLRQLVANLLQKELYIKEGYEHASTTGAIDLCNQALGKEERKNKNSVTVVKPTERIHDKYFNEWKKVQHLFSEDSSYQEAVKKAY